MEFSQGPFDPHAGGVFRKFKLFANLSEGSVGKIAQQDRLPVAFLEAIDGVVENRPDFFPRDDRLALHLAGCRVPGGPLVFLASTVLAAKFQGNEVAAPMEPRWKNRMTRKGRSLSGEIDKNHLSHFLRPDMIAPCLPKRRRINEIDMAMNQLRKGFFRSAVGIPAKEFGIICHLYHPDTAARRGITQGRPKLRTDQHCPADEAAKGHDRYWDALAGERSE